MSTHPLAHMCMPLCAYLSVHVCERTLFMVHLQASRVLAPGGSYIIVSLYPPPLLEQLLAVPDLDFKQPLDVERVPRNQSSLSILAPLTPLSTLAPLTNNINDPAG